jgi:hypothetical protein
VEVEEVEIKRRLRMRGRVEWLKSEKGGMVLVREVEDALTESRMRGSDLWLSPP